MTPGGGAPKDPVGEREQTDESLRVEREKADDAIGAPTAIDEAADAVIEKARARADAVLAAARAKSDKRSATRPSGAPPSKAIDKQRVLEDKALEEERADADETLRVERAEHAAVLSAERLETDEDLSRERARSDDALATRDEFLGIVSHDLRNMLNSVVGYAALIADGVSRENHVDQARTWAQRIQRSGARMNRLIGDLVDVASIEAGALRVACEIGDPILVVTEAVDTLQTQATASGVSLTAEVVPPIPLLAFDSARMLQVLINLLSNGIKFTPPKGKVVLRVERTGDEVRFAVRDTGVGVPSDKLDAIFERFFQVSKDRRGVGLGLYISKCIVQGHGGKIWAESTVGAGSTFTFTLPVHLAP